MRVSIPKPGLSRAPFQIVAHDPNWTEGRPKDKLMWHYARTRGPSISLRCNSPASPRPKVKQEIALLPQPRIVLTKSQEAAAAHLTVHYRLHQQNACLSGYSLRPALLAGPSGVGKTALARHMAMVLGRPLLTFDLGAWAPQGSRIEVSTIELDVHDSPPRCQQVEAQAIRSIVDSGT
jgi:hypothetical protein